MHSAICNLYAIWVNRSVTTYHHDPHPTGVTIALHMVPNRLRPERLEVRLCWQLVLSPSHDIPTEWMLDCKLCTCKMPKNWIVQRVKETINKHTDKRAKRENRQVCRMLKKAQNVYKYMILCLYNFGSTLHDVFLGHLLKFPDPLVSLRRHFRSGWSRVDIPDRLHLGVNNLQNCACWKLSCTRLCVNF
jgi:hypothetical protein